MKWYCETCWTTQHEKEEQLTSSRRRPARDDDWGEDKYGYNASPSHGRGNTYGPDRGRDRHSDDPYSHDPYAKKSYSKPDTGRAPPEYPTSAYTHSTPALGNGGSYSQYASSPARKTNSYEEDYGYGDPNAKSNGYGESKWGSSYDNYGSSTAKGGKKGGKSQDANGKGGKGKGKSKGKGKDGGKGSYSSSAATTGALGGALGAGAGYTPAPAARHSTTSYDGWDEWGETPAPAADPWADPHASAKGGKGKGKGKGEKGDKGKGKGMDGKGKGKGKPAADPWAMESAKAKGKGKPAADPWAAPAADPWAASADPWGATATTESWAEAADPWGAATGDSWTEAADPWANTAVNASWEDPWAVPAKGKGKGKDGMKGGKDAGKGKGGKDGKGKGMDKGKGKGKGVADPYGSMKGGKKGGKDTGKGKGGKDAGKGAKSKGKGGKPAKQPAAKQPPKKKQKKEHVEFDPSVGECPAESEWKGKVVEKAKVKEGSHMLQRVLYHKKELAADIAEEAQADMVEISMMNQGGHFMRKLIEVKEETSFNIVFDICIKEMCQIGKNTHGCRVVQAVINNCNDVQLTTFKNALSENIVELINDKKGMYVVKGAISRFGREGDFDFINEQVVPKFEEFANSKGGCLAVIQCCKLLKEAGDRESLDAKIEPLIDQAPELAKGEYGNYVIQNLIDLEIGALDRIVPKLIDDLTEMAVEKHASPVVEKIIQKTCGDDQIEVIKELTSNEDRLAKLCMDALGHYVIQTAVRVTSDDCFDIIVDAVANIRDKIKGDASGELVLMSMKKRENKEEGWDKPLTKQERSGKGGNKGTLKQKKAYAF